MPATGFTSVSSCRADAVLNFGSLNIDRVFRVPHLVAAGETIASRSLAEFAGGKGANQSVAAARAGLQVAHLGKVGADGRWLIERLASEGIDTRAIAVSSGPTGQAIIQVDDAGQNAIVLLAGANAEITPDEVDTALAASSAALLVVQNETSAVEHAIRRAHELGLRVAFNPAPCDARIARYPLELVELLCVNRVEGATLTGEEDPAAIVEALAGRLPSCEILLTLGADGVLYRGEAGSLHVPGVPVEAVDTTAAGDTFFGYYLAARCHGLEVQHALEVACQAAAICVTRPGAVDSIPRWEEVSG